MGVGKWKNYKRRKTQKGWATQTIIPNQLEDGTNVIITQYTHLQQEYDILRRANEVKVASVNLTGTT